MSSSSKKTVSFALQSEDEKSYYNEIATEKGYGNISTMARVALFQMLSRMKVPTWEEKAFSDRDLKLTGE